MSTLALTHRAIAEAPQLSAESQSHFEHCNERGCHRITVVLSQGLREAAPELVSRAKLALKLAETRWGLPIREGFTLHFNARPDYHNGQATVVPRNTIFVLTEAPAIDSSIGLSHEYLTETLVHEFGHMIPLQGHGGLFTLGDWILGNSSRPVGLWPRWIHEGLAVWTEATVGGRPDSGFLELELRRYSEALARKKTPPLKNSDLDGAARFGSHGRTEAGDLPYHFGYLLLNRWAQDSGGGNAPVRRLAEASSRSLGSSFRSAFREAGESLDNAFRAASQSWSETPLPTAATPRPATQGLESAEELRGPFGNESGAAWINVRAGKSRIHHRTTDGKESSWAWHESFAAPEQAFPLASGGFAVLARRRDDLAEGGIFLRGHRNMRSLVELRDAQGRLTCRPALPPRLREIDARDGLISWIRSTPDGFFFAESATLAADCALGPIREVARGQMRFERLSALYVDTHVSMLSRSPGGDSYRERIEIDGHALSYPRALSMPRPAPAAFCAGEAPCIVAHELSPRHWGPVAIAPRSGHARFLRLLTGSSRSAIVNDTLLVREGLWDEDRLGLYGSEAFQGDPQNPAAKIPKITSSGTESAANEVSPLELEPYAAWPSVWPHFWWPSMELGSRGLLLGGATFFSDTSEEWSGSAQLGYDTFFRQPFALASLRKSDLEWGPFSRASMIAVSLPTYNYKDSTSAHPTQYRWTGRMGVGTSAVLPGELRADADFFAGALQAFPSTNNSGFAFFVPGLSLSLQSSNGSPARLPGAKIGFRSEASLRSLRGPETTAGLNGHVPLGSRLTLSAGVQHGWTDTRNYPESYFEWGSLPNLATYAIPFLTRGFAPYIYAASKIARVSTEAAVNIASPAWALSWNRTRIRHIDAHFIFESVTSTMPGTKFNFGRQYFSTAGVQVEAWGSILHYVGFNLGAGVFHGFGPYGDTRYMLELGSVLEI